MSVLPVHKVGGSSLIHGTERNMTLFHGTERVRSAYFGRITVQGFSYLLTDYKSMYNLYICAYVWLYVIEPKTRYLLVPFRGIVSCSVP